MHLVPGHFVANTSWRMVTLITVVFVAAACKIINLPSPGVAIGLIVMIVASFASDQAVHLRQPAHSDPAPTFVERSMQRYPWSWIYGGWIGESLGLLLVLASI